MIKVRTYIATANVDDYFLDLLSPEKYFVEINNTDAIPLAKNTFSKQSEHVLYGVVKIELNGAAVSDFFDWDDLELIWPGILMMLKKYLKSKNASTELFTRQLKWEISFTKPESILFKITRNYPIYNSIPTIPFSKKMTGSINEKLFIQTVLEEGEKFFEFRKNLPNYQEIEPMHEELLKLKNVVNSKII